MIETIYKRKNIIIEIKMSPFFPFIEMLSTKYLENGYHPHIIRGNLDTQGVNDRKQRRSKYGAKRPK